MIIRSLLDQDLYKFTMSQVVLHSFADFEVKYRLICRTPAVTWTRQMVEEISQEIDSFCSLSLTSEEIDYLRSIRFFKPYLIETLSRYRPNRRFVKVSTEGGLRIEIEGPWFHTIQFEVPLLSIVNEVYFKHITQFDQVVQDGRKRLERKIEIARKEGFHFSDFGTRRRYSRVWHEEVIATLAQDLSPSVFTGTSNVDLARRLNLTPIGTMAHEFIQAGQADDRTSLSNSQRSMLQKWADVYRGDLGIALTDTLGIDKFIRDFDRYFATLYDGVRHDSGDPFIWAQKMLQHYERLGIDPATKRFIFSDGLDFERATQLWRVLKGKVQVAFGIGTNLTNDFEGVTPLQIVIKMVECNGRPVAKISDSPDKQVGDDAEFLKHLQRAISQ